jgi:hypothetical protein
LQEKANVVVLCAASITLVTALVPICKWLWNTYLVRKFDAKKDHYNELIEQAKWCESRAIKLDVFRKQLQYGNASDELPDKFRLSEMISKLDRRDAEWVRTVERKPLLVEAYEAKQLECMDNAEQYRQFADEVARKVLFW